MSHFAYNLLMYASMAFSLGVIVLSVKDWWRNRKLRAEWEALLNPTYVITIPVLRQDVLFEENPRNRIVRTKDYEEAMAIVNRNSEVHVMLVTDKMVG